MSHPSDLREGWRLFRPTLDEAVTPRRRAVLVGAATAVSIIVSAVVRVAEGSGGMILRPGWAALAAGLLAGCLVALVLMWRWRPAVADDLPPTGARGPAVVVPPEASREIAQAYREGREPRVPVAQRLASARAARVVRLTVPRVILPAIGASVIVVPYALFVIAAWPRIGAFGGAFSLVFVGWSVLAGLAQLGRTTAPLETAPEVPSHLHDDGRARSKPIKHLGTDHPDDYA